MGRVYGTVQQLAEYTGEPPCNNAERILRRASELLDSRVFRLCWFAADEVTGMPTDPVVAGAFAAAVCAQIEWWEETGDRLGVAAAGGTFKIGSVSISLPAAQAGAEASGRKVAETAMELLRMPDLTPDRFILGLVTGC